MKLFNNKKGFTLIELIIVIVILGILAAVAIPKYIGMKAEAAQGVAKGVASALNGAATILYSKNLVAGGDGTGYGGSTEEVGNVTPQGFTFINNSNTGANVNVSGVNCSINRTAAVGNTSPAFWTFNACP